MVAQVDEAGAAEAVQDRLGGRLAECVVAGEEGGEVDQLVRLGLWSWLWRVGVLTGISRLSEETAEVTASCAIAGSLVVE